MFINVGLRAILFNFNKNKIINFQFEYTMSVKEHIADIFAKGIVKIHMGQSISIFP